MQKHFLSCLLAAGLFACGGNPEGEKKEDKKEQVSEKAEKEAAKESQPDADSPKIDQTWVGKYTFSEKIGETQGGTPVSFVHVLEIKSDGTTTYNVDGLQTMKRNVCKLVNKNEQAAELIFEKFGEEDMFKKGYKKDDVILKLTKVSDDKLETMITDASEKTKKVTFERTK